MSVHLKSAIKSPILIFAPHKVVNEMLADFSLRGKSAGEHARRYGGRSGNISIYGRQLALATRGTLQRMTREANRRVAQISARTSGLQVWKPMRELHITASQIISPVSASPPGTQSGN